MSESKKLTKKRYNDAGTSFFLLQASFNYERMQAGGLHGQCFHYWKRYMVMIKKVCLKQ